MKNNDNLVSRVWTFLLYPESMLEDVFDKIADFHIPCFVSPLHDQDINKDGSLKKPHYHVIFYFNSQKSQAQVNSYIVQLGGTESFIVAHPVAMARYLCHLDDKDKVQYSPSDVRSYCGLVYEDVILTPKDSENFELEITQKVMLYCFENQIVSYSYLSRSLAGSDMDCFKVVFHHSYFFKSYLDALGVELGLNT